MRFLTVASKPHGIWGVRIGPLYVVVKARWNRPLYSERTGKRGKFIRLGGGWRLRFTWDRQ